VLDFGSGSMEAGPFADGAFRRSVSQLWKAVDVSSRHYSANCRFRAKGNEDVFPSQADLVASQEGAVDCDLVVAKDSLNHLVWSDLGSLLRGLRSAGVIYLLTNGSPGFDNGKRMVDESCFAGDVWSYRCFDPAGKGLSLRTTALFEAEDEEEHAGTWGLYLL
jgi:SAM-dependent methyltransferase